jgi:hypothetical protein
MKSGIRTGQGENFKNSEDEELNQKSAGNC